LKFSLILNSRNRPDHLQIFLTSVINTTKDIEDIEVIIGLDKDDPSLIDSLNVLNKYKFVNYLVQNRPINPNSSLTRLGLLSIAPYLFVLNDDTRLVTHSWDVLAWRTLSAYATRLSDDICYGRTIDQSIDKDKDGKYCAFPILPKKTIDILGFIVPPAFPGLGGDVAIYRIFEKIGRIVDIPLIIEHTMHQTLEQVINPDQTALEMRQNTYRHNTNWNTFPIDDYVFKLEDYIYKTQHLNYLNSIGCISENFSSL